MRFDTTAGEGTRLVLAHVADKVGGEDRGEVAGGGHCSVTPALRRPSKMGSSWARYVGLSLLGVNIATRLEGVCEPGTICLSEDAYR
jgi:hypothetical protein